VACLCHEDSIIWGVPFKIFYELVFETFEKKLVYFAAVLNIQDVKCRICNFLIFKNAYAKQAFPTQRFN